MMSTNTIAALLITMTPLAAGCAASAPLPVYTPPAPSYPVTVAPAPEGGTLANVPSTPAYVPRLDREAGPQPTQPDQTVVVPLTPLLPSEVITTDEPTPEPITPVPTPSSTGE